MALLFLGGSQRFLKFRHHYQTIEDILFLQLVVQRKVESYTGQRILKRQATTSEVEYEKSSKSNRRCRICIDISKGNGQKLSKDKMKKINSQCQKCGEATCKEHILWKCMSCQFLEIYFSHCIYLVFPVPNCPKVPCSYV